MLRDGVTWRAQRCGALGTTVLLANAMTIDIRPDLATIREEKIAQIREFIENAPGRRVGLQALGKQVRHQCVPQARRSVCESQEHFFGFDLDS